MTKVFVVVFFSSIVFLGGCSFIATTTFDRAPIKMEWSERKIALSNLTHWKLSGRFGAKNISDSWSGNINWLQQQNRYQINISGPLSTGSVEISGDEYSSELYVSEEESYGASNAEELLESHTGLRLPMSNLRYWLIGLPSPTSLLESIEFDEFGRLKKVAQQGWAVTFKRYSYVNDVELPNKIFLVNHEFDVRLVIQSWQILT